jgi:hypothetical protein
MGDAVLDEGGLGYLLSIIKKWVQWTPIQTLYIAIHVASWADLDSTNMAGASLERKAQEKNCEAGRLF